VPPFTGVAVNTTPVPAQTGLEDAEIVRLTSTGCVMVMVMELDVAGLPDFHNKFDVSTQLITSLPAGT
jgi:hypothetical protein